MPEIIDVHHFDSWSPLGSGHVLQGKSGLLRHGPFVGTFKSKSFKGNHQGSLEFPLKQVAVYRRVPTKLPLHKFDHTPARNDVHHFGPPGFK